MLEVFQQFGFPIAVAIVSLMAVGFLGRYLLKRMDARDEKVDKIQEQYVAYLQMSNVELTGAIKENAAAFRTNAEALKENAAALNRLSAVVERFETVIDRNHKS